MADPCVEINPYAQILQDLSPDFIRDPYAYYKKLRDTEPLALISPRRWVATGYQEVDFILKNSQFGLDFWENKLHQYGATVQSEPFFKRASDFMMMKNPPDHTRLRKSSASPFTLKMITQLRPQLQTLADASIEAFSKKGEMDVIHDFALPFCTQAIYNILGIPEEDHALLCKNTRTLARLFDPPLPLNRQEIDLENGHMQWLENYINSFFEEGNTRLGEGLILALVEARDNNELTQDEWMAQVITYLFTAIDTTPYVISNALLSLLQHPDQLMQLKKDLQQTGCISNEALNELMRYDTPVHMVNRKVFQDTEVNGRPLKKGDIVILMLAAANRDPSMFPNPDVLDLSRPKRRPLSFGGGIHTCIGVHIATLQVTIALETLLKKLPNLTLSNPSQLEWKLSYVFRGPKKMTVTW